MKYLLLWLKYAVTECFRCLISVNYTPHSAHKTTGTRADIKPALPVLSSLLTLALLLAIPVSANAGKTAPVNSADPAQVKLEDQHILEITEGAFSFTPKERARAISNRIANLAKEHDLDINKISVDDGDSVSVIGVEDIALMSVTDEDAKALQRIRPELAAEYAEKIKQAVQSYRSERSSHAVLTGAGKAIAITILLAALLVAIRKIFPWTEKKVVSWEGTFIRTIRFQSIEILHQKRAVAAIKSGLKLLRTTLVLFLLYIYIPLLLSFFIWTEGMADRLFWYIKTPVFKVGHSILAYLPNIFFVLVIVICTYYTIRFTRFFFNEIEQKNINIPGFFPDWAQPSYKIIRFLIIAFAAVMVFPYLPGSDSPAFKGVSVFLGILFSLGSSSAISNAVAGIILTYMRAFDIGDLVKISSTEGYVIEKSLLVTRIRTSKNVDTTIPNSMVLGSHITNYSSSQNLILHTAVTIGYEVPWRQVHELLKDAASRTEGLLKDPPAFVEQSALNDQDVSYVVNAYACSPDGLGGVYSQLHANIQDCFNEAGIEIMAPSITALRDGNEAAIPPEYRPNDYKPPSHWVKVVH